MEKLFCWFAFFSLWVFSPTCIAQCTGYAELNKWERGQFVEVANGTRVEVSAQFLSEVGCGSQMCDRLSRLGATIDFADNAAGYALVTIRKEMLLETLDVPGIAYAYASDDARVYFQDPSAKIPKRTASPNRCQRL